MISFGGHAKRSRIKGRVKPERSYKKLTKICLAGAVLFLVINLVVYIVFLGGTYPDTRISNYLIGATSYKKLSNKVGSLPLLPSSIYLQGKLQSFSVLPIQLGVSIDSSSIEQSAHSRNWLPVANFFISHNLKSKFKVDQVTLAHKLSDLASKDQQAAQDAHISLINNTFTLSNSIDGYQLNTAKASKLITMQVASGHSKIYLPFTAIPPKVSDASLEPTLQQLRAQQGVSLSYVYNGKTTKVPATIIASWYDEVNGQFTVQSSRIQAYINQLGASDGIHVQNLSVLVSQTESTIQKAAPATLTLIEVPQTICSQNGINQLIIVSISKQHMWACSTYNQVYDSAVVTGMENFPADLTPTGTYKIASKQTNLFLNGSDSTGSWHDYVNYWLPFLSNQYGVYGFHDATWRSNSDFGNISPNSNNASHGCVELPLSTAKWLYGWTLKGATVSITS